MARSKTVSGYLPDAILFNEETGVEEHTFIRTTTYPDNHQDWLFFSFPVNEEFERLQKAGQAYLFGDKKFPKWGSSFLAWLRLPSIEDIVSEILDRETAPGVFFSGFMTFRVFDSDGKIGVSILRALLRDIGGRYFPKDWTIRRNFVSNYSAVRDFALTIHEGHFQSAVPALYRAISEREKVTSEAKS